MLCTILLAAAAHTIEFPEVIDFSKKPFIDAYFDQVATWSKKLADNARTIGAIAFNEAPEMGAFFYTLKNDFGIGTVVETGIYQGFTTSFFANWFDEVHTIDVGEEYYQNATHTFGNFPHVHCHYGSSEKILPDILPAMQGKPVIFYLDAHWGEYWPLLDELDAISKTHRDNCIVVIDDVQVPGRPDILYDHYDTRICNYDYFKEGLSKVFSDYTYHYLIPKKSESRAKFAAIPKSFQRESILLKAREDTGLFSMVTDVLAALHSFERGAISGLEVEFGNEGLYYDPDHGPNWWNYFFKPLQVGLKKNPRSAVLEQIPNASDRKFWTSRLDAHKLIRKYIHIQPHIHEKVDAFKACYFNTPMMIGVHYRGTDADDEPTYEMFVAKIRETLVERRIDNYLIFVASDEEPFIEIMMQNFPSRVCSQIGIFRAERRGVALHKDRSYSRYQHGEEALVDCLLLASCDLLFLTNSNLSLFAAQLNPNAPIIAVSERFNANINNR